MRTINGSGRGAGALGALRTALLALVTPLLEKNPVKALAADTALERLEPRDVLSFGQVFLGRFGLGEARRLASVYAEDPSPWSHSATGLSLLLIGV